MISTVKWPVLRDASVCLRSWVWLRDLSDSVPVRSERLVVDFDVGDRFLLIAFMAIAFPFDQELKTLSFFWFEVAMCKHVFNLKCGCSVFLWWRQRCGTMLRVVVGPSFGVKNRLWSLMKVSECERETYTAGGPQPQL